MKTDTPASSLKSVAELVSFAPTPSQVKAAIRDLSAIETISPAELASPHLLAARAESLFESGAFTSRGEAQEFVGLLIKVARGERLTPAARSWFESTKDMVVRIKNLADLREIARTKESEREGVVSDMSRVTRLLDIRKSQLEFAKNVLETSSPGPLCDIPGTSPRIILAVGGDIAAAREAVVLLESKEIPGLERELDQLKAKLGNLVSEATA